ncbi:serine/threonine-protein kinase [Bradyrhizobium sp.]|uniref:serine/threonine-protein kinase n=1 Tax=Bradyrhizobium sp. TaxID=376 RepID=UPI004038059E
MEFRVQSVLGHGGFGITYRALDTVLREVVAIKEYFPNELAGRVSTATVRAKSDGDREDFELGLEAFIEEARLITRFRHPNIVHVRRFFEMHETGYIVLDYERGETLTKRLSAGPMQEDELRSILYGVLDGLDVLHERAILHRDLKPSNVIIREDDGSPVLIDFGAARDFRERHSRSITAIAAPGYSPPEQYGVGGQQGPWTDIYALGAIAYRCVTGNAPPDSLRRLRNDPMIPAVKAASGKYSASLLKTIDWMMAIEESDRPASGEAIRKALEGGRIKGKKRGVKTVALAASLAGVLATGALGAVYSGQIATLTCDHTGLLCAMRAPAQASVPVATPAAATSSATVAAPSTPAQAITPAVAPPASAPAVAAIPQGPVNPAPVATQPPAATAVAPPPPPPALPQLVTAAPGRPADPARRLLPDEIAWNMLRNGADADQLKRFIAQFPNSPYRTEATMLLSKVAQ